MTPEPIYTIQEVSAATKLPTSTLRYYEELGLLDPVSRAANGHRRFTDADLRRLNLIKKLRLTEMPIEKMREFVALYRGGTSTAKQRREILTAHRLKVEERLNDLIETLGFIDQKISMYRDEEIENERESQHEISPIG